MVYLLLPNKLWPMEVHYNLPFLSYLPLPLANLYLPVRARKDYTDASYSPTYWKLRRMLRDRGELDFGFMLPADLSLATNGNSWLYRNGVHAIQRFPFLWCISKAFLVVAKKRLTCRPRASRSYSPCSIRIRTTSAPPSSAFLNSPCGTSN